MSCATLEHPRFDFGFGYGTITLFRPTFQLCSPTNFNTTLGSEPPSHFCLGFGLLQFRSPLLSQSFVYFLFLQVLRCFSSLGSPHTSILFECMITLYCQCCVSTFGYLRISVYVQLPVAFRSLSRPSSAPSAKASTICSL